MRTTYRTLAYLVMALVAVQASVIAFGFFGLGSWIENGNDMTKAVLESNGTGIAGEAGLVLHSILGMYILPLVALAMLVLSFFLRVSGSIKWAALILTATVAQVLLAFAAFGIPTVGILHGLNAFLMLWLAVMAAKAACRPTESRTPKHSKVGMRVRAQ